MSIRDKPKITCYPLPVEAAELSPEIIQKINKLLSISDIEEYKSTYERINSLLRTISTDELRNKVYVAIIKGEWGEGKTTSYFIYVKPSAKRQYRLLSIRTNMLRVIDYLEKYGSRIDFENYAQLLLYLLIVNSDEYSENLKDRYGDILFNANEIIIRFVKDYLRDMKGLIVFVDEFEELIGERGGTNVIFQTRSVKGTFTISQIVVYGIREITRDLGRELLEQLNELGEFRLGIIIAMTPYTFIEFKNILGGYEAAGKILTMTEVIELSRLSKISNAKYINAIIGSACREGSIDHIFSDRRLVNTVHLIGSGNSRAILQLVNRLIAYREEKDLDRIDEEAFINAYKSYQFYIYLNPNDAINNEVIKLISMIKNRDRDLYNFLINSISKTIVSKELGDRGLNLVLRANQLFLKNYGFKLFIKAYLFKIDDLSLVFEVINKMMEPIFKYNLQLEEHAYTEEYKNELRNAIRRGLYNLIYYTNKGYVLVFPHPYDEESSYYLSQILSQDLVVEVDRNVMEELREIMIDSIGEHLIDEEAYIISGNALSLIYPVPTPIISRIVRDPMKGFAIWRKAQRDLSNIHVRDKVLEALALRLAKAFSIVAEKQKTHLIVSKYSLKGNNYVLKEISIDVYEGEKFSKPISLAFIIMYEPALADVINIIDNVVKKRNYLLPIIVYISREDLGPRIKRYGIENIIVKRIAPNDALPIYAIDLALREIGIEEVESANRYLEIQAGRIGLYSSFRSMYERLRRNGYIISDLKGLRKPVEKPSEILQYYQLLLLGVIERDERGFIGSLEKAIDQYFYLRALRPYGKEFGKLGLLSIDIEAKTTLRERLNIAINVFKENSFLEIVDPDKYIILDTPIENRILSILREKKSISKKLLTSIFINIASNYPDELPDLYLAMLISKGYLIVSGENIQLSTREQLINELIQVEGDLIDKLSELEDQFIRILKGLGISLGEEIHGVLAYINCKKRECKLIKTLTIKELCKKIKYKESLPLPIIYLYKELLKLYMDKVIPKFTEYVKKLDEEASSFLKLREKITSMIEIAYKDLWGIITILKLDEIRQVLVSIDEFEEINELKRRYENMIEHINEVINTINSLNKPNEIVFPKGYVPNALKYYIDPSKNDVYPIVEYISNINREISELHKHIYDAISSIEKRKGQIESGYRKLKSLSRQYDLNDYILIKDLRQSVNSIIIENIGKIDSIDKISTALEYMSKGIDKVYGRTYNELHKITIRRNNIRKLETKINETITLINLLEDKLKDIVNECSLLYSKYMDSLYTLIPASRICMKISEYKDSISKVGTSIAKIKEELMKKLEDSITDEYRFDSIYRKAKDEVSENERTLGNIGSEIGEFIRGARAYLLSAINEKAKVLNNMEKFVKDYELKATIKMLNTRISSLNESSPYESDLREYVSLLDDLIRTLNRIKSVFYNIIEKELSMSIPRERIDSVLNELTGTGKVRLSSLIKYLSIDSEKALRILKVLLDKGIIADIEAIV